MCGQCGYRRIEARLRANHVGSPTEPSSSVSGPLASTGHLTDRIGIDVTGYDIDETAVAAYRRGVDATGVIGDDDIAASDRTFTTDPDCIGDADAVFVAVPTNYDHETPTSKHEQPDGDRGSLGAAARGRVSGGSRSGGDDRRSAHPETIVVPNRRFHRGDAGAVHAVAGGGVRVRSGSGVRRRSVAGSVFLARRARCVGGGRSSWQPRSRRRRGPLQRCSTGSTTRFVSPRPRDGGGREVCRECLP